MSTLIRNNPTLSLAIVASIPISIFSYQLISKHGVKGSLRYIWEGDPYGPEIRNALTQIQKIERKLLPQTLSTINDLEISIHTRLLDDVEPSLPPEKLIPGKIKTELGGISQSLDQMAAFVDSLLSRDSVDVKKMKKRVTKKIVALMERADGLIDICADGKGGD